MSKPQIYKLYKFIKLYQLDVSLKENIDMQEFPKSMKKSSKRWKKEKSQKFKGNYKYAKKIY